MNGLKIQQQINQFEETRNSKTAFAYELDECH
jgi:hypothetical protein